LGYIGRHWRGELSLPQSYWVNGVLLLLPFNIYFKVLGAIYTATPPENALAIVYNIYLPALALLPVQVWVGVGIWRSAGVRIAQGRLGWAWVARLVVIGNTLVLAFSFLVALRQSPSLYDTYEFEQHAFASVTTKGDLVTFRGTITAKSGDDLAAALGNPAVKRLWIRGSNGGVVRSAIHAAQVIQLRGLTIIATTQCDSACTILFAAAAKRIATSTTALGFHRGTLIGTGDTPLFADPNEGDDYYSRAGMPVSMIDEIRRHAGPRDLYDPTLGALIAAGFITEIYEPGTKAYAPAWRWCLDNPKPCGRSGRDNLHRALQAQHR
jgi:hypothetical protein